MSADEGFECFERFEQGFDVSPARGKTWHSGRTGSWSRSPNAQLHTRRIGTLEMGHSWPREI